MPLWTLPFQAGRSVLAQRGEHGLRHIIISLKTALADAGAEGGPEMRWVTAIKPVQFLHSFFQNPASTAAPARVDSTHGTLNGVMKQNHAAVSREDRERQPWLIGDQSVSGIVLF